MPNQIPKEIKSLILDMDGVIWKENAPIGDLPAIFRRIHNRGLKVLFATNNGTQTPAQYADRLAGLGVTIDPQQVITSALAVAELLAQKLPAGGSVFTIGGAGVMAAVEAKGFKLLPIEKAQEAQALVFGLDVQINYEKMCEAALLIRRGVPFYATNPDRTFPTLRGEIPGAGAWVSVISLSTGKEPVFAGKPEPYLINIACQRLGTTKSETLVVGDRLETDIAAGQAAGCPVALVLSGVSRQEQATAWQPKVDIIADDLAELTY